MGCCESCFGTDDDKEPNERTPILNAAGAIATPPASNLTQSVQNGTPSADGSLSQSRPDEESLLNGILKKYSDDVVDVNAMDARIDAVEYMNRAQQYNRKLTGITCSPYEPGLKRSIDSKSVNFTLPSLDDIAFVTNHAESISKAAQNLQVASRGKLTVNFSES